MTNSTGVSVYRRGMESLEIICRNDAICFTFPDKCLKGAIYYFKHRKPYVFHYRSSYSLKYLNKGNISYRFQQGEFSLSKGEILIISPNEKTETFIGCGGAEGLSIFFKKENIKKEICRQLALEKTIMRFSESFAEKQMVRRKAIKLCREIFSKLQGDNDTIDISDLYQELEKEFVLQLLLEHWTKLRQKISLNPIFFENLRRITLATNFIHANYYKKIGLDDMASVACMSKFSFIRYFKEFFLLTPNEYLVNYRMDKAITLIRLQKRSIGAIAMDCGFNSPQYFNYSFRKKFGFSPSRLYS